MAYLGITGAVPKSGKKKKRKQKQGNGKKEASIQRECEHLLDAEHIRYIRIPDIVYSFANHPEVYRIMIRTPFKSMYIKFRKEVAEYLKSLPDITILLDSGRFIAVELKTDIGTQSQGQCKFELDVGESNYHVVRSVEEFKQLMREEEVL